MPFADEGAFKAAFRDNTPTSLVIGDLFIDSAFGIKAKTKTHAVKFDFRKGTVRFNLKKSQRLEYALNYHGATNANVKAALVVPMRLVILPFVQNGIRLGGDAAIAYAGKLNKSGKGK